MESSNEGEEIAVLSTVDQTRTEFAELVAAWLQNGVLIASALYVLVFLGMACFRVPYPYDLEWLEGGMAQQVQRVLDGAPLYCKPTLEYAPFIYTPLYTYLSAAICHYTGVGFVPLRMVSLLATLGCFLVLYRHVSRETGDWFGGLAAVGIYAATFRIGGAWFDVARVDALFLFFLLLALYWSRFATTRWGFALAGLALTAAYMTKQSTLATALPLMAVCMIVDWRKAWPLVVVPVAICGASTLALDFATGGWYTFLLYVSPIGHGVEEVMKLGFWTKDLGGKFAMACALGALGLGLQLARSWRVFAYYGVVTLGVVAMCYASRLHLGGYDNVLMPVYAWIALLVGLAVSGAAQPEGAAPRRWRLAFESGICLALILQFAQLVYNPFLQVPTSADRAAGDRLIALMRGAEGEVFVPYHNFYGALAGKKVNAHRMGINDFLGGPATREIKDQFNRELAAALREKRYGLVVMNSLVYDGLLAGGYERGTIPYDNNRVFRPVTGLATRPVYYYQRKEDADAAAIGATPAGDGAPPANAPVPAASQANTL